MCTAFPESTVVIPMTRHRGCRGFGGASARRKDRQARCAFSWMLPMVVARTGLTVRSHLFLRRSSLPGVCRPCDLRGRQASLATRGQSDTPQLCFVLWVIATNAFKYSITACCDVQARRTNQHLDSCFRLCMPTHLRRAALPPRKTPLCWRNLSQPHGMT